MPRSQTDSEIFSSSSSTINSDATFESDLDDTSHRGYQPHNSERSKLEYAGMGGGVNGLLKKKRGSDGWNSFPGPSYTVVMPVDVKFLGINLDMNRVLGKKVIDARGAALEAGVEVGDLLVEVNGMEVRGIDVDIKSFFNEDLDECNVFKFVRSSALACLSPSRLRKVFPTNAHLDDMVLRAETKRLMKEAKTGSSTMASIECIEPNEDDMGYDHLPRSTFYNVH